MNKNVRGLLVIALFSTSLGCAEDKSVPLFTSNHLKIILLRAEVRDLGGEGAVYATISVSGVNDGQLDLTCIQIQSNGVASDGVYINSVASVLPLIGLVSGGEVTEGVYWTFSKPSWQLSAGDVELTDISRRKLSTGECESNR